MNLGKTLFAQVMEFVPWTSFARIVDRYSGDARIWALPSTEHFRIMAYAQLTWRDSLRDIQATLAANPSKLYAMGLHQAVRRCTLADANERRDWRIWADFSAILIRRANKLYADEPLGLDVNIAGNVYALDILPLEAGAFYIMDRGCMDFARLYTMHQAGAFFVTRAKSNFNARRVYSATVDKTTGVVCDQWVALNGALRASRLPRAAAPGAIQRSNDGKDFDFSDQQHDVADAGHCPAL